MGKVNSHRDLVVWQRAMELVTSIYRLSARLPSHEKFGLVSQLTRAATSIPSNIAEGHARAMTRAYANCLSIAHGSLVETETFLMIAVQVGYLTETDTRTAMGEISEIGKMLTALRRRLKDRAEIGDRR